MRACFLLAAASTTLLAFVACATSDERDSASAERSEGGVLPPGADAGANDAAPDVEADAAFPTCSEAGWCTTRLPDSDLVIKDIWPLAERAFALAESATLGVKVLEWTDVDGWSYIDDNTQNSVGKIYAATIWAPNEDTVYYAVAPSFIYRGTRRSPPETGWSWSRQQLDDNSHVGEAFHASHDHGLMRKPALHADYPALGVWGVDGENVYAWYSNTVYRWASDAGGGAPGWVVEYMAGDPDVTGEHLFFVSAAGSSADDVWFSGVRSSSSGGSIPAANCVLLVHKTPAGVARLTDGVATRRDCTERSGIALVGGPAGWLTDIQSTGPGEITGLKGGEDIVRISAKGGVLTSSVDVVPVFRAAKGGANPLRSFWRSESEVWLTAWGLVIRGHGTGDAGTYSVSTISLNGGPVNTPLHRVRGTESENLWATGNGYAFHKTTP